LWTGHEKFAFAAWCHLLQLFVHDQCLHVVEWLTDRNNSSLALIRRSAFAPPVGGATYGQYSGTVDIIN